MVPHKDPRIDAYIAEAADFAKPILNLIRKRVHQVCPEVEETLKWGFPHFLYHGILCSMAAFKKHCAFGFWKGSILPDPGGILDKQRGLGMGHLGRITGVSQLPLEKIFLAYVQEAMKLNETGIKVSEVSKPKPAVKKQTEFPPYFSAALKKNKKAKKGFESLSPSHKKEYVEWIAEAKTDETRKKRLAKALEWLAEGKSRNWKYMARK